MPWYGKYDDDETEEQKIVRKVKKAMKKEDYDGGNLKAIKASEEDD
jgi:hypothetical protein